MFGISHAVTQRIIAGGRRAEVTRCEGFEIDVPFAEIGSTRPHSLENSLRKRLWKCRKRQVYNVMVEDANGNAV
jgi:hypothetical protein